MFWHSTPSGLVSDDAAASAYYQKACGGAKVNLADPAKSDGPGDVMDHLVCARLWGASATDVGLQFDALVKREEPTFANDETLGKPFLPTPPVTLH